MIPGWKSGTGFPVSTEARHQLSSEDGYWYNTPDGKRQPSWQWNTKVSNLHKNARKNVRTRLLRVFDYAESCSTRFYIDSDDYKEVMLKDWDLMQKALPACWSKTKLVALSVDEGVCQV